MVRPEVRYIIRTERLMNLKLGTLVEYEDPTSAVPSEFKGQGSQCHVMLRTGVGRYVLKEKF